ncbi:MAG: 50S ribosomal protein L4 [Candidatus Peregrinibacteria bacterium GW2011_GWA2_47_7]|nr:MAG: 50S ribosomal protein L4 [Candidatus Peregrinibacteria bacterium GW2011_GWA2_47_7]
MKATLYNQKGEKKGEVTLPKSIFEIEGGEGLVHSYLVYQQKSARRPIAHVLTKGEVRGGGKKPFAQKHTGRARQGSTRNPQMRGGGRARSRSIRSRNTQNEGFCNHVEKNAHRT